MIITITNKEELKKCLNEALIRYEKKDTLGNYENILEDDLNEIAEDIIY